MKSKLMTMIDAGEIQLDEQEKWFSAHSECEFATDEHTDDIIRRHLFDANLPIGNYEAEFSEVEFREAVEAAMNEWYKTFEGEEDEDEDLEDEAI